MNSVKIEIVTYQEQLDAIKQIRTKVFQEEQGVAAALEFDGLDDQAVHLLAYLNNQPVGTARIRTLNERTAKIERLAVLPEVRKQGLGRQLMKQALAIIVDGDYQVAIVHAQEYIQHLYQQLGFNVVEEKFIEADIPHVKMIKDFSRQLS